MVKLIVGVVGDFIGEEALQVFDHRLILIGVKETGHSGRWVDRFSVLIFLLLYVIDKLMSGNELSLFPQRLEEFANSVGGAVTPILGFDLSFPNFVLVSSNVVVNG